MNIFQRIAVAIVLLIISGCDRPLDFMLGSKSATQSSGTAAPATSAAATGSTVTDYKSLVEALRSVNVTVESGDEVEQPFFSVSGKTLKINGQDVQVFEYPDADSAKAEAGQVAPNGGSVGTSMMSWVAPPHFFKAGRVIVLYVGSDKTILDALTVALGPQFAGR